MTEAAAADDVYTEAGASIGSGAHETGCDGVQAHAKEVERKRQTRRGIWLMVTAMFLFALCDGTIKAAAGIMSPGAAVLCSSACLDLDTVQRPCLDTVQRLCLETVTRLCLGNVQRPCLDTPSCLAASLKGLRVTPHTMHPRLRPHPLGVPHCCVRVQGGCPSLNYDRLRPSARVHVQTNTAH